MDDPGDASEGARATVDAVRERIAAAADPIERTETLPVTTAVGRPLAEAVTARRAVPHYDRVAADGAAVRAADTDGADADAPVRFDLSETAGPDAAVRVDSGDRLPDGADAVVPAATRSANATRAARTSDESGDSRAGHAAVRDGELLVREAVSPGDNVQSTGADVAAGQTVLEAGRVLRASDPALCRAVGRTRVEVAQRPTVGIVPTGDALVGNDPGPGEVVETDGSTVAALVEDWGGKVTYRDPVESDADALRVAVERDLTKDLLVTTGGTGRGSRDRVRDAIAALGEVRASDVALDPGGSTAFGVVRERPVVALPGDPVACLVAAVQVVGPAVATLSRRPAPAPRTTEARLAEAVSSERGVRTVVPVASTDGTSERVRPLSPDDGALSTIARADGWIAVDEERTGVPAGERVAVERWTLGA